MNGKKIKSKSKMLHPIATLGCLLTCLLSFHSFFLFFVASRLSVTYDDIITEMEPKLTPLHGGFVLLYKTLTLTIISLFVVVDSFMCPRFSSFVILVSIHIFAHK